MGRRLLLEQCHSPLAASGPSGHLCSDPTDVASRGHCRFESCTGTNKWPSRFSWPCLWRGVIGAISEERVKSFVYVAALAPDEGETVAQVFYRDEPHRDAPK